MNRRPFAVVLLALLAFLLQSADPDAPAGAVRAGDGTVLVPRVGAPDDEEALRRRLVELVAARAARLSADELRIAIAAAENDNAPLPPAAQEVLGALQDQAAEIQAEANRKIGLHRQAAIADLKELMDKFTRDGDLDEAVAVRDLMRALRMPAFAAAADPGNLSAFADRIGRSFHFRITGNANGSVYGTNVYTSDSSLATAAVHAGVLRNGQTGIVKVIMMPGHETYQPSVRNGVSSHGWGQYPTSYRVEAVPLEELEQKPAPDVEKVDKPKDER